MSSYCYEALDSGGLTLRGTLDVPDQGEALRRIKEMGLFPVKLAEVNRFRRQTEVPALRPFSLKKEIPIPFLSGRVKPSALAVFTRQLATLVDAGLPLLRGLRILQEQETNATLKRIIGKLAESIEGGSSLSEALAAHPRVFNRLYTNMTKAGEMAGALEITFRRLAEFMEKTRKIKGKVVAALVYPVTVLLVATAILWAMMTFIIPRFQLVFDGLLNGAPMPPFTLFVLGISTTVRNHALATGLCGIAATAAFLYVIHTRWGRRAFDRCKLRMPILGPVFRKLAVSRFTRTLGTLLGSGVPILQALTIVKETTGNVIVANAISRVHESVKEGETIAAPLKTSGAFPAMVVGMVDVGEQTGALPEMLLKVAEVYDDEVDNAVSAMTSLLEPLLLLFLAVVVGSIVIAMFLPLIAILPGIDSNSNRSEQ